jgi:hypothetical protein
MQGPAGRLVLCVCVRVQRRLRWYLVAMHVAAVTVFPFFFLLARSRLLVAIAYTVLHGPCIWPFDHHHVPVRKLGIFSFNLIQIISAIYVMTCICMCV